MENKTFYIEKLLLENFGKFHKKEILLTPGINVIYGNNEAGKSTVLAFIRGMLFGIEKGRGRISKDDLYTKYLPWDTETLYSGKMELFVDGAGYLVSRNFYKEVKQSKYYDRKTGQEYTITGGRPDFLPEELTAASFRNTLLVEQRQLGTDRDFVMAVKNFAANMSSTGTDDVDVASAISHLQKKKKNIVSRQTSLMKKEVEDQIYQLGDIIGQKDRLFGEIMKLENQVRELEKFTGQQWKALQETRLVPVKQQKHKFFWLIIEIIAGIFGVTQLYQKVYLNFFLCILVVIGCIIVDNRQYLYGKQNINQKAGENPYNQMERLEQEAKKLEEGRVQLERLHWEMADLEAEEQMLEQLNSRLTELSRLENKEREELQAIKLAIDTICTLAKEIHNRFGDSLNQKASQIISEITGEKYTNLFIDEDLNMKVLCDNQYIDISRLSEGTIAQMYLALRLAVGELLFPDKKVPVLLDESFSFYDEKRFYNVMSWLEKQDRQVILFSCQEREISYMKKNKIPYHLVKL
ncbi:ATP-binding protein [Anaeromicropila populeti]|uniref:AAA domain-containing protein n=1 Tax=Anaeromicropila populeti TaxID=37658 RepID=A0A1I6IXT8_9FIRM|nr:AAA family ATPase [Anaeromicropila populeti]SFR71451.1 AAA domain-containing protein [Anaeromicropila populeti]